MCREGHAVSPSALEAIMNSDEMRGAICRMRAGRDAWTTCPYPTATALPSGQTVSTQ